MHVLEPAIRFIFLIYKRGIFEMLARIMCVVLFDVRCDYFRLNYHREEFVWIISGKF